MTVLFADVVQSMDIAAAVGAERLREIMSELLDRSTAVVKRYGGTLSQFTGDDLKQISDELSVSPSTVRTHLQHLFVKTDTHRQAELIRHLLAISQ